MTEAFPACVTPACVIIVGLIWFMGLIIGLFRMETMFVRSTTIAAVITHFVFIDRPDPLRQHFAINVAIGWEWHGLAGEENGLRSLSGRP